MTKKQKAKLRKQLLPTVPSVKVAARRKKVQHLQPAVVAERTGGLSWWGGLKWYAARHRTELILIGILLVVSIAAHSWNMLHYPYIENDEATYTSRAWAFIHEGRLDVYTYRYDHAPLGWILLGLWHVLTGGTALFSSFIVSGRFFMLSLHAVSTVLLYVLVKRFTNGNKLAASVAVLLFSLSPLAIYFQRRILLDNIMTFWVLLSLFFATEPRHRLKNYIWSAVLFGVAVLTKLNAVFFAPAYVYIVWRKAHPAHRSHAVMYWLFVAGSVIGAFFLYALLKGELFQAPLDAAGNPTHVSVVETFKLQLGRGEFAWPWLPDSSLRQNVNSWVMKDWFILAAGTVSALIVTAVAVVRRKQYPYLLGLVIAYWAYMAFLGRGKIVIDLYIVPFIPFMAAMVGVLVALAAQACRRNRLLYVSYYAVVVAIGIALFSTLPYKQYLNNETSNQLQGVSWIEQHIPKDATIAADNYVYPYLANQSGYTNVSYFFSTEYDPEVRRAYGDDWRNIQYLVLTHEVVQQIKTGTVPKMRELLDHSTLLADYRADTTSYIDLPHYISTNGDWVQIYQVKPRVQIVLQDTWRYFKDHFMVSYGQVIEPAKNDLTTSTGQALAMQRAVEEHDEQTFQGVWQWSKDHIRFRTDDVLLSWKWEKQPTGQYALADSNNVCGADEVVAYSLYRADELWPKAGYAAEAQEHLADWWRKCVVTINGRLYIDSSADGSQGTRLIDPTDFKPSYYRYFADKMPDKPWGQLVDDGYGILNILMDTFGTVPTWANVSADGKVSSAVAIMGPTADSFSYDSLELVHSLAADALINGQPKAVDALGRMATPIERLGVSTGDAPAYKVAYMLYLQSVDPQSDRIAAMYNDTISTPYDKKTGAWLDGDYYNQQWFWQWHQLQASLPRDKQMDIK